MPFVDLLLKENAISDNGEYKKAKEKCMKNKDKVI